MPIRRSSKSSWNPLRARLRQQWQRRREFSPEAWVKARSSPCSLGFSGHCQDCNKDPISYTYPISRNAIFWYTVSQEFRGQNFGYLQSATLVISYVMKKNKLNFKEAIAEIRKYRPTVLPNLGFERQLKQYEKMLKIEDLSVTRKLISKTSQSRKHQSKKLPQIALPQIFALGKTLGRPKNMEPPPLLQPSSQMENRKLRRPQIDELRMAVNEQNYSQGYFKYYEPLTNRLPIKSFRKRSISISRKLPKSLTGSDQPVELVRLPPHKLAINEIRFETQKVIKSTMLKQLYH